MIAEALENAIYNGATLRVRYFGGSSPGGEREIQPISVKDGKVRARCLLSGETKTFVIEKMELVVEGAPSELASTLLPPVVTYGSVNEFFVNHTASLQALGWIVQCEGESISLHRAFKNGKVIQTPDIAIQYQATDSDLVFDGQQIFETNHRDRARPWIVRTKIHTTKTYGNFGKAQLTFLELAKSLSPLAGSRNA